MSAAPKLFVLKNNLLTEMANFQSLIKENGEKGREILLLGDSVMQNATQGQLRKFISSALELSRSPEAPLFYFLTKSLIEALKKGHLMVASFILDNGFNINDPHLPHILNTVIKDTAVTDNVALIVVQFLHRYSFDFNLQEKETYWAPLHYAVQRSLQRTIESLIDLGADVNIVAEKDTMPLNIALQVVQRPALSSTPVVATIDSDNASDSKDKSNTNGVEPASIMTQKESIDDDPVEVLLARSIVELLENRGAKETWRRGITATSLPQNEIYSAIGAPRESCSISATLPKAPVPSVAPGVNNNKVSFSGNMIGQNTISTAGKKTMVRFSGASIESISAHTNNNDAFTFSTASADVASQPHIWKNLKTATQDPSGNRSPLPVPPESEGYVPPETKSSTAAGMTGSNAFEAESAASAVFLGESDDGNAFLFSTGN
jgi:hypothetical protein